MSTTAELWAAALGYVLPLAIAVVNRPTWSAPVKGLLAVLVAAADGIGSAYFAGQFTGKTTVACVLVAAAAIGVAYRTLWQPSGIAGVIERATSHHPSAPPTGA